MGEGFEGYTKPLSSELFADLPQQHEVPLLHAASAGETKAL